MIAAVLLIVFFIGCASDRWARGFAAIVPISALQTYLCFARGKALFVEVERALALRPLSAETAFFLTLICLSITYSAGYFCAKALQNLAAVKNMPERSSRSHDVGHASMTRRLPAPPLY